MIATRIPSPSPSVEHPISFFFGDASAIWNPLGKWI
jgi:hypothetical protein